MVKDLLSTLTAQFDKYKEFLTHKEYFQMLKQAVDNKETDRKLAAANKLKENKEKNEKDRIAEDAKLKTAETDFAAW